MPRPYSCPPVAQLVRVLPTLDRVVVSLPKRLAIDPIMGTVIGGPELAPLDRAILIVPARDLPGQVREHRLAAIVSLPTMGHAGCRHSLFGAVAYVSGQAFGGNSAVSRHEVRSTAVDGLFLILNVTLAQPRRPTQGVG